MASEIARMFTSLGFKVDLTGLNQFEAKVRSATQNMNQFARKLHSVSGKLTTVTQKVLALNKALNKDQKATGKGTSGYYSKLANYVERVDKAHNKLNQTAPSVVTSLNKIKASVHKSSNAWERYTKAVTAAKQALRGLNVGGLGSGSRITINQRTTTNNYQGGRGGGGFAPPRPYSEQNQQSGGTMILGGLQNFFRSMSPAAAMAGGLVSTGFVLKEIVQAGREVQKMQNVIMMASGGAGSEMEHNLKYIDDTTKEMGVSYVEFGNAYAKMLSATKDSPLSRGTKETMFKDLSAYMVAIGSSTDDQKGIFRALTQMFTKGKVQAEEMLQMAERGVPAAMEIKRAVVEGLGLTNEQFDKMQQKGQLDPNKILPIMAANFGKVARETGAYAAAAKSSQAAQQRLTNSWENFSFAILKSGLDEGLGKLFNSLAELLILLTPIAKGFVEVVKSLGVFSNSISEGSTSTKLFYGALLVASLWLIRLRGATRASSTVMRILNGNIKLAWRLFGGLAKRIIWVTTVITVLSKVFTDVSKHIGGEDNWVTLLTLQLELLGLRIDVAGLKVWNFWQRLKFYKNPFTAWNDGLDGEHEDRRTGWQKTKDWFGTFFNGASTDFVQQAINKQQQSGRINDKVGTPFMLQKPQGNSKFTLEIKEGGKVVSTRELNWGDAINYTHTTR